MSLSLFQPVTPQSMLQLVELCRLLFLMIGGRAGITIAKSAARLLSFMYASWGKVKHCGLKHGAPSLRRQGDACRTLTKFVADPRRGLSTMMLIRRLNDRVLKWSLQSC